MKLKIYITISFLILLSKSVLPENELRNTKNIPGQFSAIASQHIQREQSITILIM